MLNELNKQSKNKKSRRWSYRRGWAKMTGRSYENDLMKMMRQNYDYRSGQTKQERRDYEHGLTNENDLMKIEQDYRHYRIEELQFFPSEAREKKWLIELGEDADE